MTTLTRGATRPDGFRFWAYEKTRGKFREKWLSPEPYGRAVEFCRVYRRTWKKKVSV